MAKAKKKSVAKVKVAIKTPAKSSAAKRALKKVSYGVGVIVRKVSKVGKVSTPKIWTAAKKSVLSVFKFPRKPLAEPAVPAVKVSPKKKKKSVKKVVRRSKPAAPEAVQPEIL
ncbi:MAG: hypothetical protein HQL20_09810 [Candidatus Omnitrophica bacterium]|nr:hypothetical protein [Candidatus Omnitrophota bacterium]